jgi:uncharacterized protein YaaQ
MKLVIAIVHHEDSGVLMEAFSKSKIPVTKLASTGGFLRAGNVTLMIGTESDKVESVMEIISGVCKSRTELIAPGTAGMMAAASWPVEITVGGATIFVIDVDRYIKI